MSRAPAPDAVSAVSEFHIAGSLALSFFLLFLWTGGRLSLTFLSRVLLASFLTGLSSFV